MLLNTAGEAKASDAAGDRPTHDPVDDQRDDIDGKEYFSPRKFHVAVALHLQKPVLWHGVILSQV